MIAAAGQNSFTRGTMTQDCAGHGPLGNKADLTKSRDMSSLRVIASELKSAGKSAQEAVTGKSHSPISTAVWGKHRQLDQWVQSSI